MYHGTGQSGWNQQPQSDNTYQQTPQYGQTYGVERPNVYGFPIEQRQDVAAFTSPPRMQTPGESIRTPRENVVRGPAQHAGYYKGYPPGQYPIMDPKARHHSGISAMRGHDRTAQMQNLFLQPNVPPVEAGYDSASKGPLQPQYSTSMRSEQNVRGQAPRPGMDYNYSRAYTDSHHYTSYPQQARFPYNRGTTHSYPHAGQPTSSQSPRFQNVYQPSSSAMPYGQQNRYLAPGVNSGMMPPVLKASPMRPISSDISNQLQAPQTSMPGYVARQDGKRPSYDAPHPQLPTSLPYVGHQQAMAPSAKPSISDDFNLDSLLDDPVGTSGSFMQQLEDIVPDASRSRRNSTQNSAIMNQPNVINSPQKNSMSNLPVGQREAQMSSMSANQSFHLQRGRRLSGSNMAPMQAQMSGGLPKPMMPQSNVSSLTNDPTNISLAVPGYHSQNVMQSPPHHSGGVVPGPGLESQSVSYPRQATQNLLQSPQRSLPMGSPDLQHRQSPYKSPTGSIRMMGPQPRSHMVQTSKHGIRMPYPQTQPHQHSMDFGRSPQHTPMMSPPPQMHNIPQPVACGTMPSMQESPHKPTGNNYAPYPQSYQQQQQRPLPVPDQTMSCINQQHPPDLQEAILPVAGPGHQKSVNGGVSQQQLQPVLKSSQAPHSVAKLVIQQAEPTANIPLENVPSTDVPLQPCQKANPVVQPDQVQDAADALKLELDVAESQAADIAPLSDEPPSTTFNSAVGIELDRPKQTEERTPVPKQDAAEKERLDDSVQHSLQPELSEVSEPAFSKSSDNLQQPAKVNANELPNYDVGTAPSTDHISVPCDNASSQANVVDAAVQPLGIQQTSQFSTQVTVSQLASNTHRPPEVQKQATQASPSTLGLHYSGLPRSQPTALPHRPRGVLQGHFSSGPDTQALVPEVAGPYPPGQHPMQRAGLHHGPGHRYHSNNVGQSRNIVPMIGSRPGQAVHHTPQSMPAVSQSQGITRHQGQNIYSQPGPMPVPQVYPARPGYSPTQDAYRFHGPHNYPPRPYGPQNQPGTYYPHHMNYRMQPPGAMLPQQPQHAAQQFHGPSPRQMHMYGYSADGAITSGWHGPRHPSINAPEEMHTGMVRGGMVTPDSSLPEKSGKKSKAKEKEGGLKIKKEKSKKQTEKKNARGDGSERSNDPAKVPMKATPSKPEKKKPPATFKLKKRKRKKGEDADDFDSLLPSDSAIDESLKRRSARNVKRKQYTESFDCQLSDEMSDGEMEVFNYMKAQQVELKQAEEVANDQMIVEKILDMRMRRVEKVLTEEDKNKPKDSEDEEKPSELETDKNEKSQQCGSQDEKETTVDEKNKKHDATAAGDSEDTKLKEKRLSSSQDDGKEYEEVKEFFIKYKNYSYLHCEWKTKNEIQDKRVDGKIKRYESKMAAIPEYLKAEISEAFNPDFVEVERVLDVAQDEDDGSGSPAENRYFVKWCALPYEDCTWEQGADIPGCKIKEFEERCKYRPQLNVPEIPRKNSFRKLGEQDSVFLNNNQLRDYQLEGINWLLFNWYNRRNCILADEMGLGKTVQSITFLQKVFDHGIQGPFLIVAPLSTICNWQREFASWTNMNAVVYHGSQISRDMIKTYEFLCRDENLDELPGQYKMHAVITTYEMIVLEGSHLQDIDWKCSIIDEAHRLKNQTCKLADSLRSMHLDFKVLLTGTPLQNNVEELFALLNFLQPEMFSSTEAFIAEFGDMKNNSQVEKLQELLKPMMLRRLKEDVEKSLAPKEETIIEVELTSIQKKYYRAIMERNFDFLSKGAVTGNIPNLMNTMMELRKCCNHPYLIKGAEDKIHSEQVGDESALQTMIQSSGKLVLIDKLLPRLKSGGHKVLIFSQMVRCLDILEDYLVQSEYSYERIDGGIRGSDRQAAIDRFSKPDSERFVFLLCTRAGGLGINLTAADTVIIFDSDWNPQNDLQAQARCHRIGQTKTVKIYRLITRNSYEREMFDKASLKLGLDKAVLQSISGRQDDVNQNASPALSKVEIENLLKLGAYGSIMDENDDANKFCEEDIDHILLRRTQTITIAPGQKGSTFSKASFISGEEGSEISLNDPNFWEKWAKKADLDIHRLKNNKLIIEEPRRRKQTRRFGGMTQDVEVLAELGSDSDSDYDEKVQARRQKNKSRAKNWSKRDYFRVEKSLLAYGWGRWKHVLQKGGVPGQMKVKELETVCRAMLMYCLKFYSGDEKIKVFMWNLITPTTCPAVTLMPSLEGLTTPVSRGRKGRSVKNESGIAYERIAQEWVKEVDVNAVLQEDSFKKHLQHHCNKILLRVRMLYFLQTEILSSLTGDINEITADHLELSFPDMIPDNLLPGWDFECDKNLLLGVHKHGFGKYNLIRADSKLCFLKKFGMPDDKSLAEDLDDSGEDDNEDPEYKPAKLNFSEYSELEDSPASNTPGTAPASPASMDCSQDSTKGKLIESKEKDDGKENSDESVPKKEEEKTQDVKEYVEEEKPATKEPETEAKPVVISWPIASELNMRVRRIVACYQKQHKQIRSRLMGLDQGSPKTKLRESSRERTHWTRREESDFYRTISTFGVEYAKRSFSWTRFRQLAKLDKKSDKSLEMYYLAFKAMCESACGHKAPLPEEIARINVTRVTEERASRTLYRIELLNRIRLDVLQHKELDKRLKKCEHSADLPAWWNPGQHDKELLLGMDRHGVTRTEIHILNDISLSFLKSMIEYEQNQVLQNRRKRIHSPDSMSGNSEKKKKDDTDSSKGSDKKAEDEPDKPEVSKSIESLSQAEESLFSSHLQSAQKWPKDRVLIQRVEHVCYCVIHGKWPISRVPEESTSSFLKNPISMPSSGINSLPKSTGPVAGSGEQALLLDAEGRLLDEASSKILSIIAAQSEFKDDTRSFFKSKRSSPDEALQQSQKLSSVKKIENSDSAKASAHSNPIFNLCLSNSKFNKTLQTLLKSDLSRFSLPQNTLLTEAISYSQPKEKLTATKRPKEEILPPVTTANSEKVSRPNIFGSPAKKKKEERGIIKKKTPKSKTGFISPAVLPPDSRIPVYNPSEKKKLVGDEAPLNKDLADWLKQHPGFVVDYKTLREKLNEEPPTSSENSTPSTTSCTPQSSQKLSSAAPPPKKTVSEYRKTDDRPSSRAHTPTAEPKASQPLSSHQANLLNQSLLNPGILNALYGNSPDISALIASGILPGLPSFSGERTIDPLFHQSSSSNSQSKHKNHGHSNKSITTPAAPQIPDMASLFGLSNMQNTADMAALAALFGGYAPTNVSSKDMQKQLKQLFDQPPSQFDPKLLQLGGLGVPPFFPGMPGAMNPLLYGMYGNPELAAMQDFFHPMHMSSFLESEYAKVKDGNNLNAIQELVAAQHMLMANLGYDANAPDFQKFLRAQEALQPPTSLNLGKSSTSGQTNDFDDNLRAVYQQLHSSSLQKELYENRKKEKADRHKHEKKSSPEDDAPIDLRRMEQPHKK